MNTKAKIICPLLAAILSISLCSCGGGSDKITGTLPDVPANSENAAISADAVEKTADFSVKLLQNAYNGESVVLSPLCLVFGLSQLAEGCEGETESQIVSATGMSTTETAEFTAAYLKKLKQSLNIDICASTSLWINEKYSVKSSFTKLSKNNYLAHIYKTDFGKSTESTMTSWLKTTSGNVIRKTVISDFTDATAYLADAVCLTAKWEEQYSEDAVFGIFTASDGTEIKADYLVSNEDKYVSIPSGTGFIKNYEGGEYAFAAIMPDEGVSIGDFVAGLSGKALTEGLKNSKSAAIKVSLPSFTANGKNKLKSVLEKSGISDIFSDKADFSGISGKSGLKLDDALQCAYFAVTAKGTADEEPTVQSADEETEEPEYELVFDRPFVYAVIDTQTYCPILIGVADNLD